MTAYVRLFGYRGRSPIKIINATHDVVGVPVLLVQPYEWAEYIEVTVGEEPKMTQAHPERDITLLRMEVIGQIRYEVNSPTRFAKATNYSPGFADGETEILFGSGWRLSIIEASS